MWLYYWGMTERQVDLLLADQPLVVYDHESKNGKGEGKRKVGRHEFAKPSAGDMLEAKARFGQKHGLRGDGKVSINMSNIFKSNKQL